MTIKNESNTIKLYKAYGLQFIGKTADYTSYITGETETVITAIAVIETKTNNVIYKEKLYNRIILFSTFEKYCDDILYYFAKNEHDEIDVENIIDRLITNNLIGFAINIAQQKKTEKEMQEKIEKIKKEKEIEKQVFELIEKNNLVQYDVDGNFYILKMTPETATRWNMIVDSEKKNVLKMVSENNFPEIEILYKGTCSFIYNKMSNGDYLNSYTELEPALEFLKEYSTKEPVYTFCNKTLLEAYPVLKNRTFIGKQLVEVYRDLINKKQFPDFEEWKKEMLEKKFLKEL